MADSNTYQALLVEETSPGQFTRRIVERSLDALPAGEVLVRVKYSSLNYKDALSASGNKGVTQSYPHVPGIDAAGVVETSECKEYKPGDEVLITTGELGVNFPGGYSQYIRVPGDWLVPLPKGLTLRQSMIYGTAGFTAAMCVDRLQAFAITPETGEILVTGATGGVGSIAISILAKEKYKVVALTGKPEKEHLLRVLGASDVIDRTQLSDNNNRPLLHARWAGVVDTVGGAILAAAIRSTKPAGVITACGNAASAELKLTVYPFILRGVSLLGIDALMPNQKERRRLWDKLAHEWKPETLDEMAREVPLEKVDEEIQRMLLGGQAGRVLVNIDR